VRPQYDSQVELLRRSLAYNELSVASDGKVVTTAEKSDLRFKLGYCKECPGAPILLYNIIKSKINPLWVTRDPRFIAGECGGGICFVCHPEQEQILRTSRSHGSSLGRRTGESTGSPISKRNNYREPRTPPRRRDSAAGLSSSSYRPGMTSEPNLSQLPLTQRAVTTTMLSPTMRQTNGREIKPSWNTTTQQDMHTEPPSGEIRDHDVTSGSHRNKAWLGVTVPPMVGGHPTSDIGNSNPRRASTSSMMREEYEAAAMGGYPNNDKLHRASTTAMRAQRTAAIDGYSQESLRRASTSAMVKGGYLATTIDGYSNGMEDGNVMHTPSSMMNGVHEIPAMEGYPIAMDDVNLVRGPSTMMNRVYIPSAMEVYPYVRDGMDVARSPSPMTKNRGYASPAMDEYPTETDDMPVSHRAPSSMMKGAHPPIRTNRYSNEIGDMKLPSSATKGLYDRPGIGGYGTAINGYASAIGRMTAMDSMNIPQAPTAMMMNEAYGHPTMDEYSSEMDEMTGTNTSSSMTNGLYPAIRMDGYSDGMEDRKVAHTPSSMMNERVGDLGFSSMSLAPSSMGKDSVDEMDSANTTFARASGGMSMVGSSQTRQGTSSREGSAETWNSDVGHHMPSDFTLSSYETSDDQSRPLRGYETSDDQSRPLRGYETSDDQSRPLRGGTRGRRVQSVVQSTMTTDELEFSYFPYERAVSSETDDLVQPSLPNRTGSAPKSQADLESVIEGINELLVDVRASESSEMMAVILLGALREHANSSAVLVHCLGLIGDVCQESDSHRRAMVNGKATEDIVRSSRNHMTNIEVQEKASLALWAMCTESSAIIAFVRDGACIQMISVLQRHISNENVVGCVLSAVRTLSHQKEGRDVFQKTDASRVISQGMVLHRKSVRIQLDGCATLSNLALRLENKLVMIVEKPEVDAVVQAMANHRLKDSVRKEACLALMNFTLQETNCRTLRSCKGAEQLITFAAQLDAEQGLVGDAANVLERMQLSQILDESIEEEACGTLMGLANHNDQRITPQVVQSILNFMHEYEWSLCVSQRSIALLQTIVHSVSSQEVGELFTADTLNQIMQCASHFDDEKMMENICGFLAAIGASHSFGNADAFLLPASRILLASLRCSKSNSGLALSSFQALLNLLDAEAVYNELVENRALVNEIIVEHASSIAIQDIGITIYCRLDSATTT